MHDHDTTEAERIKELLNTKYCKVDLDKLSQKCEHLSKEELFILLIKHDQLFDGTLGTWNTNPVDLTFRDTNCTPCLAAPAARRLILWHATIDQWYPRA